MDRKLGKIGLALGAGAARGWAHIGAIKALEDIGLSPDVVCGSSMGALVGAAYAADRLDALEAWALDLDRSKVLGMFDVSFRGGLIQARRLFDYLASELPDCQLGELPRVFGAVATDLENGSEVWMRQGSLHDALRASIALPGLITPTRVGERWLVDGGLVDPVPVSLCRALGADVVIAVELSAGPPPPFVEYTEALRQAAQETPAPSPGQQNLVQPEQESSAEAFEAVVDDLEPKSGEARNAQQTPMTLAPGRESGLFTSLGELAERLRERLQFSREPAPIDAPSVYEVIVKSLVIMQTRLTRSRMAGDPPELHVVPRLQGIGLLDFDRAGDAIPEGARAVQTALAAQADFYGLEPETSPKETVK